MRGLKIGSAMAVAFFAAACADQTPTAPVATRGPSLSTTASTLAACPAGTTTFPLSWTNNRGDDVNVGSVVVTNDAKNLYVKYTTTGTWKMDYAYTLVASKKGDVPTRGNNDVKLEKFDSKRFRPQATSYTDTTALGRNKAGDQVVIVAASLVEGMYAKNNNRNAKKVNRLAWSGNKDLFASRNNRRDRDDDERDRDDDGDKANARYFQYTIAACGTPAPSDSTPTKDTTTVPKDTTTPRDTTTPPPAAKKGVIAITFDDGFRDAYTYGFTEMKKYGLIGNVAVNPGPVDSGWTGYVTVPMLNEMSAAGWSIVSHSYNHPDLTTISDAALDHELRDSQAWIRAHGYRGANVFIVPYHSWGAREEAAIRKYYTAARGHTIGEWVPDSMATYPTTNPFGLTGYEPEYAPYTTPEGRAATRAVMQKAVDEGKFVDIFFHQIPAANSAAFAEMVKIMAEFKPYIKPYSTLFPGA